MRRTGYNLLLAGAALLALGWPASRANELRETYERSVVGLHVTFQEWDQDRPWVKLAPRKRTASAVLVGERQLLTTAQMLDHAVLLTVEAFGRDWDVRPVIERIDRSVNLALLTFEDGADLSAFRPVVVADRTPISGTLRTARWRKQQIEDAASRVIRLEVERAWGSHTNHAFLRLRTDMAGGGWADPVFAGDKLVGLTVSQAGDESRAIPAEILRAFLDRDPDSGAAHGFTTLGVNWQINRDVGVSRFLGQQGEPRGILVRQVPWGASACGVLKPRDILLELNGQAIDADGYYDHPWLGYLRFEHLLAENLRPGQRVPVRVLREGRERELTLTARTYPFVLELVPSYQSSPPPYLIAAGLVLRELDVPYLRTWGKEWTKDAPDALLSRFYFSQEAQTPQRRRIVFISSVLPTAYNIGYHDLSDDVVEGINGRTIGKIEDAVEALSHPQGGFHVIELAPDSTRNRIVLDAATFENATAEVIEAYDVPSALRARAEALPPGGPDCPGDF